MYAAGARARLSKATRARVLCLVGLSPAVVTETLWALAVRRRPRVIDAELHIVTTRAGLAGVASTLLGAAGALARLRATYRLPAVAFRCPPAHLHVLADARGDPLDDILTTRDSEAVGEQIGHGEHFDLNSSPMGCPDGNGITPPGLNATFRRTLE
jgi:CRISPR-associated protein (TIGR02584 family)